MVKQEADLGRRFHEYMTARAQSFTGTPQRSPPRTPVQSGPRSGAFSRSTQGVSEQLKQVRFVEVCKGVETLTFPPAIQDHAVGFHHS